MEEKGNLLDSLLGGAIEYAKTSYELIKLNAIDKIRLVVSSVVSRIIALFIISMSLLMGSIGLAFWLGDILGKSWYGFFIVAGFYALIGVVLSFLLHKWIKKLVSNCFIKKVLK